MNDDELIVFRYKLDIPDVGPLRRRYIPTQKEIQLYMKIIENNIRLYTNTTPRRVRIRRWLWRRKHSMIMFYYHHFRRFRIWYHRTIA